MTTITVQLDDTKAELLRERAKELGLSPDQFVAASIGDLLAYAKPEFEAAVQKVLSTNKELYERLELHTRIITTTGGSHGIHNLAGNVVQMT